MTYQNKIEQKKKQNKYKDSHTGQKSILWKFGVQTFYQCVVHFSNEYLYIWNKWVSANWERLLRVFLLSYLFMV